MILAGFQVGWKVHTYSCYGNQITALLHDPLSLTEWLMFVKLRTVTGTQQTRTQVLVSTPSQRSGVKNLEGKSKGWEGK